MSRERDAVVYTSEQGSVRPSSVTVPSGYHAASVLEHVQQPLPWEADHEARRPAFTTLTGVFTFTFPASLEYPAAWLNDDGIEISFTESLSLVYLYASRQPGGGGIEIDGAPPAERRLYGRETQPGRVRTYSGEFLAYSQLAVPYGISVTITFTDCGVAAVRANHIALIP